MSAVVSNVFKSICEEYLDPAGVKVGGYPQELFKDLAEQKREAYECRICYLLAKEAQRCCNGHLFCAACIYAWCLTSEDNVDRCPVCRQHGSYRTDASAAAALAQEAVVCPSAGCEWRGRLSDLRAHEHGLAFAGVDARRAGLPFVRSPAGEAVFPDFGDGPAGGGFRATLEMERIRRRQRLARMQGHVLDGQARLSFLMSLFEEDLERRRSNLAAIASMQRRFHGQQFDQLMRLEQELGEITANLLRLIESASGEALRFNHTLQRDLPQQDAAAAAGAVGGLTQQQPYAAAAAAPTSAASVASATSAAYASSIRGSSGLRAAAAADSAPAAVPRLASSSGSRERLLQRESLANVLSRVLHNAATGTSGDRLALETGSRDWSSRDRRSPARDVPHPPAAPPSPGASHVLPPPTASSRNVPDFNRPWIAASFDRGHSSATLSSSSARVDTALCDGRLSNGGAAAAVCSDKAEPAPASSRGVEGVDAIPSVARSALLQQQQRQSDRTVGAGTYNPHVITYPPHRPMGVGLPAAAVTSSRTSSHAALSTRSGAAAAAQAAAGSTHGSREVSSLPTSALSQQRFASAAAVPSSSTTLLPQSARQSAAQGGSATAQPNSVARSYNR